MGKNDVLRPHAIGIQDLKYFAVYNRWGQRVFYTTNEGGGLGRDTRRAGAAGGDVCLDGPRVGFLGPVGVEAGDGHLDQIRGIFAGMLGKLAGWADTIVALRRRRVSGRSA